MCMYDCSIGLLVSTSIYLSTYLSIKMELLLEFLWPANLWPLYVSLCKN